MSGGAIALVVIGVLVDQVNEVVGVDLASIEKAPTFGSSLRNEFMRGVANLNGQFVVVLDVERVLNVDELSAIESMAG